MSDKTGIEWTDATWNPLAGCSLKSPGCTNCYAMKFAHRLLDKPGSHYYGTTKIVNGKAVWTGKINLAPDRILRLPLTWKKPRRIFPNSMSDLFHEDVPDEWIDRIFAVMALSQQHTYQILTKRAERMHDYMTTRWQPAKAQRLEIAGTAIDYPGETTGDTREDRVRQAASDLLIGDIGEQDKFWTADGSMRWPCWPLPNVWLGVSVEDQKRADERIPWLLKTPAAVRFLSCEPLLEPVNIRGYLMQGEDPGKCLTCCMNHGFTRCPNYGGISKTRTGLDENCETFLRKNFAIHWVIAGGESGPGARPMNPAWVRSIRDQCHHAGVPFFFKQWGEWAPLYGLLSENSCKHTGIFKWSDGWQDGCCSLRVGKKAAGRLLDGRTHDDFPVYLQPAA